MAFIRERKAGDTFYYELVESVRTGGKVGQKVIEYLGNREKMLEYCKRHGMKPPKQKYAMLDDCTAFLLAQKLAKLNSLRPLHPQAVESLAKKFEVEMTYNSNAIEGNRLTLRETAMVLQRGLTISGKSMREHLEATNHLEALKFLEKIADGRKQISEADVLELHALIMDKIAPEMAGFYRRWQVAITGATHRPPSWKEVPKLMAGVLAELNSKRKGAAALESAARLHHLISWIHPFGDGNGRMARLLANLRLMRAGFPPAVLQRRIRRSYYNALESADNGDFRPLASIMARDEIRALGEWIEAAD